MSPGLASGLLGIGLLATAQAAAGVPLCRAHVELTPPQAVIGQQVVYRLRIQRRWDVSAVRWEHNLSFPALRAEWLPGSVGSDVTLPDSESYQLFEERRALFAARAGRLEIPSASLICRGPDGEEATVIPATSLLVMPPPSAGRPPDWSGVVGRVRLQTRVTPTRIAVGESARVRVVVEGPANVWDARPALEAALAGASLEVFAHEEELARDAGRQLTLRRYQSFDLVPRREGTVLVPSLSVPWLDPETWTFQRATSPPVVLTVDPAKTLPPAEVPAAPQASPEVVSPIWPGLGVVLALVAIAGIWQLLRRRTRPREDSADAIRDALAEAQRAEAAGDVQTAGSALSRAVRRCLEARVPGALGLATEELFGMVRDDDSRALVLLLQRLDRARFTREGSLAEVRSVRESLARIRRPLREVPR